MELVTLDHKEFGIQENKAKEIASQFKPMLSKMEELENEYNEVVSLPVDKPESAKKAKELRLKYVKVRTGTAKIHKEQKDFYLAGGRYVDGWKNAQIFASQGKEEALMAIEKHQENLEKERLNNLQLDRAGKLSQYIEDAGERDLSGMDEDVWNAYFETKKQAYLDQIEAEKKAEQQRIENERLNEIERKREREIAPYLEFVGDTSSDLRNMDDKDYGSLIINLKKAKAEHDKEQEEIRKENARLKKEREASKAKAKKEREDREAKEKQQQLAREKKEAEAKAEHEAQLKKEREAREKLEAEAKSRKDAEEKAKLEAKKKEQFELGKGDADKVNDLLNDLKTLKSKYSFKSDKNKKMYSDTGILIDKVIAHINK